MSDKSKYQALNHKLPLFFKSWWLDAVCDGDWDYAVINEGNEILALWPFQMERKLGFKILRNPLLTPYLGPLWISEREKQADWIEVLWQQLPKSDFMQWSCVPEFEGKDFLSKLDILHKEKVTYFLDLNHTEVELWANLHTTRRNGIRKGEKELVISKSDFTIDEFIKSHSLSFENKGKKYPYSPSFLTNITQAAKANKSCLCFTATDTNGKPQGVLWLAFDSNKMYYLLSTTTLDANRGTMALLTWNAILEAKKMTLKIFDFEGSMDAGIARFFQRFGGTKMSYDEFSITTSPLWKLKSKLLG
ncbi:MAG: GNAT family N-acetyltransferase [Chitinophagaceae bacterium]